MTAPAQAQPGLAGGLNFSSIDDAVGSEASQEGLLDQSTGFHIGVFYNVDVGPVSLRPGVFFREIGQYQLQREENGVTENFDLRSLEIPLDTRLHVLSLPLIRTYVLAAPVIGLPGGDEGIRDATENLSLTADIGAGFEVSVPGVRATVKPEFRYSLGGTSFFQDEFEVGNATFRPEDADQFTSVMLRLGVMFR